MDVVTSSFELRYYSNVINSQFYRRDLSGISLWIRVAFGPSPGRLEEIHRFGCAARPPGHVKISNRWIVCGAMTHREHPPGNYIICNTWKEARIFFQSPRKDSESVVWKILIRLISIQYIESYEFELRSCLAIHCMKKYLQAGRLIFCETFVMQS